MILRESDLLKIETPFYNVFTRINHPSLTEELKKGNRILLIYENELKLEPKTGSLEANIVYNVYKFQQQIADVNQGNTNQS